MDTIYVYQNTEKKLDRKKKTIDGMKFIEGPHRIKIYYEKAARINKNKYLPLYQSGDQSTCSYSLKLEKIGRFFNARDTKFESISKTIMHPENVANQRQMTYFKYKHPCYVPNYRYKYDRFDPFEKTSPNPTIKRRSTAMKSISDVISRNQSAFTSKTYKVSAAKIRKSNRVYSKTSQSKDSIPSVKTAMLSESSLYKSSAKQDKRNVNLYKPNSKLSNMCDDNVISLYKTEALTSDNRMNSVLSLHDMKLNKLVAVRRHRGRKKRQRRILLRYQHKSSKCVSNSPRIKVVEVEDIHNGTAVNNKQYPPEMMSLKSPVPIISSSDFDVRFHEDGINKNILECENNSKPKINENLLMRQNKIYCKNTIMSAASENIIGMRSSNNLWDYDTLRKIHSARKWLNLCYLVKQYISRPIDQSIMPSEITKMAKIIILSWLLKIIITMNEKRVPKTKDNSNSTFITKHCKEFTPPKCISGVCINDQGDISKCLMLIAHRNNNDLNGGRIYNVNNNKISISSSITKNAKLSKRSTAKKQRSKRQSKIKIPPRHSRALENINVCSYQPVALNFQLSFTNDVYNDKLNRSSYKNVPSKNIFTCTPIQELYYNVPRSIIKKSGRNILQQNDISNEPNNINNGLVWKNFHKLKCINVSSKFNSRDYQVWALRRNRRHHYQPQVKKRTSRMSRLSDKSDKKSHEKSLSSKNKNVECTNVIARNSTTATNNSQIEKLNVDTEELELHCKHDSVNNSSIDNYVSNADEVKYDNVLQNSLSKFAVENKKYIFFTPNLESKHLNKHKGSQCLVKKDALTVAKGKPDNCESELQNSLYDGEKCVGEKSSPSQNNIRSILELLRRIDYKLSKPNFLHHTPKVFDFFKQKMQNFTNYGK